MGKVYTDGNYAYYERFDSETLVVSKKNTQKIERKHLPLRTLYNRLTRKGFDFRRQSRCTKSASGLSSTSGVSGGITLFNEFRTRPRSRHGKRIITVLVRQHRRRCIPSHCVNVRT
ncbi:MAG: hypothetical protein LBU65_13945 [Planctomycetaceae bacterium]|nr:hypothetical protein [Planctomycetaceae bacterium]